MLIVATLDTDVIQTAIRNFLNKQSLVKMGGERKLLDLAERKRIFFSGILNLIGRCWVQYCLTSELLMRESDLVSF
jgi:hypothetical protein